jgi:hypothetical protein
MKHSLRVYGRRKVLRSMQPCEKRNPCAILMCDAYSVNCYRWFRPCVQYMCMPCISLSDFGHSYHRALIARSFGIRHKCNLYVCTPDGYLKYADAGRLSNSIQTQMFQLTVPNGPTDDGIASRRQNWLSDQCYVG